MKAICGGLSPSLTQHHLGARGPSHSCPVRRTSTPCRTGLRGLVLPLPHSRHWNNPDTTKLQHGLQATQGEEIGTAERAASQNAAGSSGNGAGPYHGGSNGVEARLASGRGTSSSGNGAYVGNGALGGNGAADRETAVEIVDTLEPIERLETVNGADISGAWADPCTVGHLEACAADRLAAKEKETTAPEEVASGTAAAEVSRSVERRDAPTSARGTPYRASSKWSRLLKVSSLQRTFQIWAFAAFFTIKYWLLARRFTYGKQGMTPQRVAARKMRLASWLREGLIKLGPTFIKIGQQFSTRVDVLSPEFVKELEQLQDNVPAFDSEAAVSIVERELGGPITTVFDEFEAEPIAAASLGQVHLAKLRGRTVVVKVQRPGLRQLFDIDLKNIRILAQWLQAADPQSDGAARDWVAIYDECSRILYQEIDYKLEGQNADRFRKCFADTPWVKVPEIIWEASSSEVLTMEYCPGIKVNRIDELDRLGVDRKLLARRSVESYLQQLLTHGFFHADPHPGNIAVDAVDGGRLIYYDFGMMGVIPSDVRSGLLELFYGVYQKDPDRCIDALVTMGVLVPGGDRVAIRRTAEFFLANFSERLEAQRREAETNPTYGETFKAQPTKEEKKAKRKQILASIGEDLLLASADKPFRFPATFTFVVRSFTVLDGIGKGLDPRFDISEIAAPYARNLLLEAKPQIARLQKDVQRRFSEQNRAVRNLFANPNRLEAVANTLGQLERGDLKLRVRALEAERALTRVQAGQKVTSSVVLASMLVNVATVLSVSAITTAATVTYIGAGFAGLNVVVNWLKLKNLERKEAQLSGA